MTHDFQCSEVLTKTVFSVYSRQKKTSQLVCSERANENNDAKRAAQ